MTQEEINRLLAKARMCNRVEEIIIDKEVLIKRRFRGSATGNTGDIVHNYNNIIYTINIKDDEKIVYIPDGVQAVGLGFLGVIDNSLRHLIRYPKKIKVVGGKDLITAIGLFDRFGNTSSIVNRKYGIDLLDLTDLEFSKVKDLQSMLKGCIVKELKLWKCKTSYVKSFNALFLDAHINNIENIEYLDTKEQRAYMNDAFYYFNGDTLDLSNFKLYRLINQECFRKSKINKLILNEKELKDNDLYNWVKSLCIEEQIGEIEYR